MGRLGMKAWLGFVVLAGFLAQQACAEVEIPSLKWNAGARSDWIDARTDASLKTHAAGDGTTDDTAALQAALDLASTKNSKRATVYLPPGRYKITHTLYWNTPGPGKPWGGSGLWLVGSGRDTTIAWAGEAGAAMFEDLGATRTRYSGIVWDAGPPDKAAGFGIAHVSISLYQSRMRHENEAFIGFTGVNGKGSLQTPRYTPVAGSKTAFDRSTFAETLPAAGIMTGTKGAATPSAEFMIFNCQFQRDTIGAAVGYEFFNYYMYEFQDCDFQDCGIGISSLDGKTIALDCSFARSSDADIRTGNGLTFHARRCTSSGSRMFFTTSQGGGMPSDVIEDCWIDGWTHVAKGKQDSGAIRLGDRGPAMVFDCKFTHPPSADSPINVTDYGKMNYQLFLSGNVWEGKSPLVSTGSGGGLATIYDIPPGRLKGGITSLARMPERFLKSTWPADSAHILDVTRPPYSLPANESVDATVTLQKAIDDAKAAADGTIVYLPIGSYKITAPLQVSGSNYVIQGSGLQSRIVWEADPHQGTMMLVDTPRDIRLEQFALNPPRLPTLPSPAVGCIEVTSKAPCSLTIDGVYSSQGGVYNMEGPGLVLSHLPKGSFMNLHHLDMPLTVHDCGPAEILGDFLQGGRVMVDGATAPKSGFLGALVLEGGQFNRAEDYDISIHDNQNFVCSDYYNEQSYNNLDLEGGGDGTPGSVTIQSFKQNSEQFYPPNTGAPVRTIQINVKDYAGQLFYGPGPFFDFNPVNVVQTGRGPFNLILAGDIFGGGDPASTITTQPGCQLIELGDVWQSRNEPPTAVPNRPDPVTPEAGRALADGLDQLRQLDLEDMKAHGIAAPSLGRKTAKP